jgi:hypothetical protein
MSLLLAPVGAEEEIKHSENAPGPSKPRAPGRAPAGSTRGTNMVMASHGRSPWYDPDGKNVDAYVIGIAGGSASGKVSCLNVRPDPPKLTL